MKCHIVFKGKTQLFKTVLEFLNHTKHGVTLFHYIFNKLLKDLLPVSFFSKNFYTEFSIIMENHQLKLNFDL